MTEKTPVNNSLPADTVKRREAEKEALKANLRRRKAPSEPDQNAS